MFDTAPTHGAAASRLRQGHGGLKKEPSMLETIAIILVVLWLVGLVTSTTMGGLIHVLLVIAIVVILIRVISGRRL
jgi:hypothetical protein